MEEGESECKGEHMDRRTFVEAVAALALAIRLRSIEKDDVLAGGSVSAPYPGSKGSKPPFLDAAAGATATSIAGEWRLCLDPQDVGIKEEWFKDSNPFRDRILLPGSADEHRFGQKNDKREPYHLTRTYDYTGAVWYQFDVVIPGSWQGKRVALYLERCHWETQAWLDDHHLGLRNSLSTPHIYEVGNVSAPTERGERALSIGPHRLTVRVDNRTKVDIGLSSATTAEVGATWNGIIGRMELHSTDLVWIDAISIYPVLTENAVHVRIEVRNLTGEVHSAEIRLAGGLSRTADAEFGATTRVVVSHLPTTVFEQDLHLGTDPERWSEFSPSVFHLSASLVSTAVGTSFSSQAHTTFGLRELSTSGQQLKLNGNTIVIRGTVDNGTFPKQGYVPMDVAFWRNRLQVYMDYGFNHVRFHSWCPPDAAFTAADELGILFQVENPLWIPGGWVSEDDERTEFIHNEAQRIVDTYGNHPSFGLMTMGNEEGSGQDVFLGNLVRYLQQRDPRHLYSSTSAPDNIRRPDNYFVSAGPHWTNLRGDPRLENRPPNTNVDYDEYLAKAGVDRPLIAHELGQWTVFPNLEEYREYIGPLQPRYLDIYQEAIERNHLLGQAEVFRRASGALTVALYKEEIEAILRTHHVSGFQLLGLTDFPGFGPAFIGVLDTLGESKGLIAPQEFRRFCAPTVPLLRLSKRLWTTDETLTASAEIAHYGPNALKNVGASWVIRDSAATTVATGSFPAVNIETGSSTQLGEIKISLGRFPAPARYSIEFSVGGSVNAWNLWFYPEKLPPPPSGLTLSKAWDDSTRNALREGKTVVLLLDPQEPAHTVPTSFTTIFWAASWFPKRHETMGILCDPAHPALKLFTTDFHSDWQWWELMSRSRAFDLTRAPDDFRPIVQVVDDAASSRRLGTIIEARVGSGKLLATCFDLESAPAKRLAARQLRASLLGYAASPEFQPQTELEAQYVDSLFKGVNH
jgi:hypothetical protein